MRRAPEFDPYRILGVSRGTSRADIAAAHRRLAKSTHPDLHGSDGVARMQAINRAWFLLSDAGRRAAWDAAHPDPLTAAPHWVTPTSGRATAGDYPGSARPAGLPRSRRDSGWLALGVAGLMIVAVIGVGGIAAGIAVPRTLDDAIAAEGGSGKAANATMLDDRHALVVWREDAGHLKAMHFEQRDGGEWSVSEQIMTAVRGALSVNFLVIEEGQGAWNAFAFGAATPDVDRVELPALGGLGGDVFAGTWGIALPALDVDPERVAWRFVASDGHELLAGAGPLDS